MSHELKKIGSINKQILELIYNSNLVIANLTSLNPNVMYELAFRHSTGKPVITIAERGTKIPFDVIDARTIFYRYDPLGMEELRNELVKFNKEIIDAPKKYYGPIMEALEGVFYEQRLKELLLNTNNENDLTAIIEKIIQLFDKAVSTTNADNIYSSNDDKEEINIENRIFFEYSTLKEKFGRTPNDYEIAQSYFKKYGFRDESKIRDKINKMFLKY